MRLQTNDISLRAAGFGPPPRAMRKRLKAHQARALIRLREIGALNLWRAANGILLLDYRTFVRVIIDALAHVGDASRRCVCVSDVRAALPRDVAGEISNAEILRHISTVPLGSRLLAASDAGRLVELVEIERRELEEEGMVLRTLNPRDETHFARSQRRAARRRLKARLRNVEYRKRKQTSGAKCVSLDVATSLANVANQRDDSIDMKAASRAVATSDETQAGRVHAAIVAGCASVAEIVTNTNLDHRVVRPLLTRLLKARRIERAGRGRYRARAP